MTLASLLSSIVEHEAAISIFSGIFSAAASVLLAVLYKRQTDIQKDQADLMKASHNPYVVKRKTYVSEDKYPPAKIKHSLLNIGSGPATNLRQYVSLDFTHEVLNGVDREQDLWRSPPQMKGTFEENFLTPDDLSEFETSYGGDYATINNKNLEELTEEEKEEYNIGDHRIYSLDNMLDFLYDKDIEKATIEITIKYDTILDETRELEVIPSNTVIQLGDYCGDSSRSLSRRLHTNNTNSF